MSQTNRPRITKTIPLDQGISTGQLTYDYMAGEHVSMDRLITTTSNSNETIRVLDISGAAGCLQYLFAVCKNDTGGTSDFTTRITLDGVQIYEKLFPIPNGAQNAVHPVGGTFWKSALPIGLYFSENYFDVSCVVDVICERSFVEVCVVNKYYLMSGNVDTNVQELVVL